MTSSICPTLDPVAPSDRHADDTRYTVVMTSECRATPGRTAWSWRSSDEDSFAERSGSCCTSRHPPRPGIHKNYTKSQSSILLHVEEVIGDTRQSNEPILPKCRLLQKATISICHPLLHILPCLSLWGRTRGFSDNHSKTSVPDHKL